VNESGGKVEGRNESERDERDENVENEKDEREERNNSFHCHPWVFTATSTAVLITQHDRVEIQKVSFSFFFFISSDIRAC